MIKAKIKGSIVSYDQGIFKCFNPELLELLSEKYNQDYHGYQPDPNFAMMSWITKKLGGEIAYSDSPETVDRNVVY